MKYRSQAVKERADAIRRLERKIIVLCGRAFDQPKLVRGTRISIDKYYAQLCIIYDHLLLDMPVRSVHVPDVLWILVHRKVGLVDGNGNIIYAKYNSGHNVTSSQGAFSNGTSNDVRAIA